MKLLLGIKCKSRCEDASHPAAYKSQLLNCAIFENTTNFLSSAEQTFSNIEYNFFFFGGVGKGGDDSRRGKNVVLELVKEQHSLAREAKAFENLFFFRIKEALI